MNGNNTSKSDLDKIIKSAQNSLSISNVSVSGVLLSNDLYDEDGKLIDEKEKLFIEHISDNVPLFYNTVGTAAIKAKFEDISKENTITYLIYSTGKFIIGGVREEEEIQETLDIIKEKIESVQKNPFIQDTDECYELDPTYSIENIIFTGNLPCQIRMETIEENVEREDVLLAQNNKEIEERNDVDENDLSGYIKHLKSFPSIMIHSDENSSETTSLFESGKFNISGISTNNLKEAKKKARNTVKKSIERLNTLDNVFKWHSLDLYGPKVKEITQGEKLEIIGKLENFKEEGIEDTLKLVDDSGDVIDSKEFKLNSKERKRVSLNFDSSDFDVGDYNFSLEDSVNSKEVTIKIL